MLEVLFQAIGLGLAAAVPIGPVNLEIMRRGLRGGFPPAFLTGLGAASLDGVYSVLFTLGFSLTTNETVLAWIAKGGAGVLAVLGILTLREALMRRPGDREAGRPGNSTVTAVSKTQNLPSRKASARLRPKHETRNDLAWSYGTGFLMTALNPMTLMFWASVGATAAAIVRDGVAGRLVFSGGVVGGALLWVIVLSTTLHVTRHRIGPRVTKGLTIAGGLGLLAFAVKLLL